MESQDIIEDDTGAAPASPGPDTHPVQLDVQPVGTPPRHGEWPPDLAEQPSEGRDCQSCRWVFTWNNYGDQHPVYNAGVHEYICWQYEFAPTTGTPHIQGYVRYKNRKRWSWVCKQYPGAYVALAKGTEQQCMEYCKKESSRQPGSLPLAFGSYRPEAGRQGKRSDLDSVYDDIKAGATEKAIVDKYPSDFIRYHAGIKRAIDIACQPEVPTKRDMRVVCLWGPTGSGKSHLVHTMFQNSYWAEPGRGPFDNYKFEPVLVFDEFEPGDWPITMVLKYLDVWKLELACRYSNKRAAWTTVVIIQNNNPDALYMMATPAHRDALHRRFGPCYYKTEQQQDLEACERVPDYDPRTGLCTDIRPRADR